MYQEWFEEYEKIKNSKNNEEVCPMCRKEVGINDKRIL